MIFTFEDAKFRAEAIAIANKSLKPLANAMQLKITEEVRDYPNLTVRRYGEGKTGRIATSPRDVVDSGELRDSYQTSISVTKDMITFTASWSTPYATYIYLGTSKTPSYAWVEMTLQQSDLNTIFQN